MGTMKGWETRRRRQAEQAKEWDDAVFAAGVAEERARLRPLLERCAERLKWHRDGAATVDVVQGRWLEEDAILADLRRELGKG